MATGDASATGRFPVAELADKYVGSLDNIGGGQYLAFRDVVPMPPGLRDFGGKKEFYGQAYTIKATDCNLLVREAVQTPGKGRVLVVDGGGSMRCALLGDRLAHLAVDNGWEGLLVYGCIRDTAIIRQLPLGVKALGVHPLKSSQMDVHKGEAHVTIDIEGVVVHEDDWIYADSDGVIVSRKALEL